MILDEPSFMKYVYYDQKGKMLIKEDASEKMKREFEEFKKMIEAIPDENGIVRQY